MKVMCIIGTRPEAIKMFPIVKRLSATPGVVSRVVVTGQHRELLAQALSLFDLSPDHDLDVMLPDQTPLQVLREVTKRLEVVLVQERPDWILIHGDTTSALAAALVGAHTKCRMAHVEAGLRSYDRENPFPEEINRVVVDHLVDLHFAPTEKAREHLLHEGIAPSSVFVTGNSVIDALDYILERVEPSQASDLREGKKLVVVTVHRRENHGEALTEVLEALADLAARTDVRIVLPVHPNPKVWGPVHRRLGSLPNVLLEAPLDYARFVRLLSQASLVLTDSGGIQEEACALGLPVLVLRQVTERPEAVEAGIAQLVGTDRERIVLESTRILDGSMRVDRAKARSVYGDGRTAERIVQILLAHEAGRNPHPASG